MVRGIDRPENGFGILWPSDFGGRVSRTCFVHATTTGTAVPITDITKAAVSHQVIDLVKTPFGYAAALHARLPGSAAALLLLDETGKPRGPVRRLLGTKYPWAIASLGNESGMMVTRTGGTPQFRSFDMKGDPLGP